MIDDYAKLDQVFGVQDKPQPSKQQVKATATVTQIQQQNEETLV